MKEAAIINYIIQHFPFNISSDNLIFKVKAAVILKGK